MTALQSFSPVATTSASVLLRSRPPANSRPMRRRTRVLPLDQQGIRADWLTRGIEEANCALFHAALYPILPKLKARIRSWLKSHGADPSMARDQLLIADLALGVIVLAFEKGRRWRQNQSVLDWLASFIPVVYAKSQPAYAAHQIAAR